MNIPKGPAFAQIEIKKSKFLAYALPLASLADIKEEVAKARREHPDSRHVVHAAVVGPEGGEFSLSDDGEPKGTSGRPSLEVLKGRDVTNVLVLIVRYFGGTKLGTGGLVKAYGDAVKAVLEELDTEPLVQKADFRLNLTYHDHSPVRLLLEKEGVEILSEEFAEGVTLTGRCPRAVLDTLGEPIRDLTRGAARIDILEESL
ncbi:MAG: IMPACT family protein [Spirochaetales bacterium]|nr:IMPACT family protein [Spirochaetales bacterium]